MHCKGHGNHAVGYEYTEIFTDDRIPEEFLACQGRYDEQGMEQDDSQDCLLIAGLLYRSAAYQKGCNRKLPNLGMCPIGGEGPHVLKEDQLSPAGQDR